MINSIMTHVYKISFNYKYLEGKKLTFDKHFCVLDDVKDKNRSVVQYSIMTLNKSL